MTKEPEQVPELVNSMIGHRLITKQTPPDGIPVSKVMVAEAIDIVRETYFCILMDREYNGPVIVASPDGGVDIEEVAEKTPERIKKVPVDIKVGLTDAMADEISEFLGFEGDLKEQCSQQVKRLYEMFLKVILRSYLITTTCIVRSFARRNGLLIRCEIFRFLKKLLNRGKSLLESWGTTFLPD